MRGGIGGREGQRGGPGEVGPAARRRRERSSTYAASDGVRGRRLRRGLVVSAILLTACSGDPSRQIDRLASSAATARLIAADRLSGAVPSHFSRRLLADLSNEVKTGAESLGRESLPAPLQGQVLASAAELRRVLADEQKAVEADDRGRLRAAMLRAQAAAGRLRALSQRASSGGQR
jgi:hypothetical protein